VLADGDKHFAGHVSALLRSGRLVLNVDACCALLDEELRELHDCGEAAVTGIRIGDDGSEVVDTGSVRSVCFGCGEALFSLLAVVKELGHEEVADLVRDRGVGVVC
jgi:hypothetical protein